MQVWGGKDEYARRLLLTVLYGLTLTVVPYLLWYSLLPEWYPWKRFLRGLPVIAALLCFSWLPGRAGKAVLIGLYALCVPLAVAEALHLAVYDISIAPETLYAFFETSQSEAMEAFASYISFKTVFAVVAGIGIPAFFLRLLLKMPFVFYRKTALCAVVLALCLAGGVPQIFRISLMGHAVDSWLEYRQYNTALHDFSRNAANYDLSSVRDLFPGQARTIVVVVGESATRHHLGLYGYHRPTTPFFSSIRDELLVFSDMISRYGFTAANITGMLTVAKMNGIDDVPVMELFHKAGFQTFWISNQSTFLFGEGLFHLVYAADKVIPVNPDDALGVPGRYDDRVLPVLDEILKTSAPSGTRLIFINIMGSHLKYHSRFPSEFVRFASGNDIPDAPWRDENAKMRINDYDNSVLYTDHILSEIVGRLRSVPGSALAYLSDHGQEVYDTQDHMGHGATLSSRYFVDVPFVLWLSPSFRQARADDARRWSAYTDRPGVTDCFSSVLAELCGITFADLQRDHNVLSPYFVPSMRRSLDGAYDEKFAGGKGLNKADLVRP